MEWSWFLLSRVISPNFTAGTVKTPHERESECSLCWPRFVLGTSLKQATRFTYWARCITNIRDIHYMCTNIDHYMWMTPKYGVVAALQNFLGTSLFDSWPENRLSWLMFLVNVLSFFWRMDSTSIRSRPLPHKAFLFIIHSTSWHSTPYAIKYWQRR